MTTMKPCPKCHSTEHLRIEIIDDHLSASRSVKVGCTECHTFTQIDYVLTGPFANERWNEHCDDWGGVSIMSERTCANCNGRVCTVDGLIVGSHGAACEYYRVRRAGGGKADMDIRCPNCGEQIDRINKGNVFVCEKGKPLMREVRYYCRHCDSTVIFLKKCEPEGVDHD